MNANENITPKIEELLFFVNQTKNSQSHYLGNNTSVTNLFTGGLIYVDTRDITVAPHLMSKGEWEPLKSALLLDTLSQTSHFIDAGANFGYFAVIARSVVTDGAIVAVEANSIFEATLHKSFRVNGITSSNVDIRAISETSGDTISFSFYEDDWASSGVFEQSAADQTHRKGLSKKEIKVQTVSVDDLVNDHGLNASDDMVIKIDVEGMELESLIGAEKTLKQKPTLFLEITPTLCSDLNTLVGILEQYPICLQIIDSIGGVRAVKSIKEQLLSGPSNESVELILGAESVRQKLNRHIKYS